MDRAKVVTTWNDIAQLQLEIYAREFQELRGEVRRLRAKLVEYGKPEPNPVPQIKNGKEAAASKVALYEGDIRLDVQVDGSPGLVVDFVSQLRDQPEVRVRRMDAKRNGLVSLLISLRQPVSLRLVLTEIEGVSQVQTDPNGTGPTMKLILAENESRTPS